MQKAEEETEQEQPKCKRNNTDRDAERFYAISNSWHRQRRKNTHGRATQSLVFLIQLMTKKTLIVTDFFFLSIWNNLTENKGWLVTASVQTPFLIH